ncbi:MAG: low molecular weight phosphotyrosine protein phosphatase [Saprospiraceae bacterium]|nr:low molecular weight phosphotyrosine protein phosphatase [Saprospiraceae bacterium]
MKVLMVCLGNICRSPLAEGILKHKVQNLGLDWLVDSAGTGSWHVGELPDRRSIAVAKKYGIDITDQRARHFKPKDLDAFDLILVMDRDNYSDVVRQAKTELQKEKVQLIMNFVYPNSQTIVPDPYYDNRFELVYELLNEASDALIAHYSK